MTVQLKQIETKRLCVCTAAIYAMQCELISELQPFMSLEAQAITANWCIVRKNLEEDSDGRDWQCECDI
jgi:hypothetical protein